MAKMPAISAVRSLARRVHALSKRAAFDLVETKTDDIVEAEKMLTLTGMAPGALAPAGADYTHFVTATIKVHDEWRTLAYQVVSKKTGTPVISDIIEWSVNQSPQKALDEIAEKAESDVMKVLGKLEIVSCDPRDAVMTFEYKDNTRAPEAIQCKSPLLIEDIPAGEYTLVRPGEAPAGHFGLAVSDYTHATAPNRRYADLIIQRLIKAQLAVGDQEETDNVNRF